MERACFIASSPWGVEVYKEANLACSPLLKMFTADHLYYSRKSKLKTEECRDLSSKYQHLIFKSPNRECASWGTSVIAISKPAESILKRNILLATPYNRSFYWMQMAEEAYELSKNIDNKIQEVNLDFSKFKNLDYKMNGSSFCSSPSFEGSCLPFSQLFNESYDKRDNLNLMSLSFESVSTLGNSYNQKLKVTQKELAAFERLARDLSVNRSKSTILKNELQDLIDKSKVNFHFDKELGEF